MLTHQPQVSAKLTAAIRIVAFVMCWSLAACGGAQSSTSTPQAARFPVSITQPDGVVVTIEHQPRRVISLSPSATEMLFAIGAGPQVVAVDDQSNYPSNAPTTKLSGFQPNIEAIAGYAPDLVVASEDAGSLVHGMQALNVPILIEPAAKTLDDSYLQIKQLGMATGHSVDADALVAKMRSEISAFVSLLSRPARPLTVYHELDNTYFSATSATFIGQVYKMLGLENIADGAAGKVSDYPQLSAEYIVASNPDLIVLADTKCCKQDLGTVARRPGWGGIAAVKSGQVVGIDDDIASRWGPRVIDFMRAIAPHVQQLEKAA
jgi:iron complex transport system substrate-binding protein